jgi:hypothetical protein
MNRLSLFLLVAAACGGASKPAPTTPIPDDPKTAAAAPAPAPEPAPAAPPAPPPPAPPLDVKIPAQQTTVKLVTPGKGKKEAIRYALKAGGKQSVELALDFSGKQDTEEHTVPTIVLAADAETKAVKDGTAEYTFTVTGTDARANAAAADIPLDKFRQVLGVLVGLQVNGSFGASGTAGDVTLHMEHPPRGFEQALELIRVTLPRVPSLPTEAVGVGAKWQATTAAKVADRLDVTQTTDYELVAHKGTTWTIKGTTKVVGKEQSIETAKVSGIAGTGTTEATIDSSQIYPTVKSTLETEFTASDKDKSAKYAIKVGSAVTPK